MFQIGTFQHFATGKRGGVGREVKATNTKALTHTNTHTFSLTWMTLSKNGKSCPIHFLSTE